MNLYEGIKDSVKEQTYIIKQTAGNFGTYKICEWKSTSPEKAVEEFTNENPEFKDGKKGHITAVLKEADNKKCVLCGKHFKEWGNDPWPLADEGWCCDKCNSEKVIPARIAMAYKKEEPKDIKESDDYSRKIDRAGMEGLRIKELGKDDLTDEMKKTFPEATKGICYLDIRSYVGKGDNKVNLFKEDGTELGCSFFNLPNLDEAEYGDGARHYSNALIDLCEQGILSWENVAHGLINYCSEDDIKDFCDSYQYTDLIDNPTGDDSFEDSENLKEEENKFISPAKDYPDFVREKLANKEDATTWHCDSCHEYFEEPESKRTDMEDYYGVGGDFPDHHYQNLLYCPKCGSDDIEEQNIFFDSIVDEVLDDPEGSQIVYEEMAKRRPELIKTDEVTLQDLIDEPEILDIVAEII